MITFLGAPTKCSSLDRFTALRVRFRCGSHVPIRFFWSIHLSTDLCDAPVNNGTNSMFLAFRSSRILTSTNSIAKRLKSLSFVITQIKFEKKVKFHRFKKNQKWSPYHVMVDYLQLMMLKFKIGAKLMLFCTILRIWRFLSFLWWEFFFSNEGDCWTNYLPFTIYNYFLCYGELLRYVYWELRKKKNNIRCNETWIGHHGVR